MIASRSRALIAAAGLVLFGAGRLAAQDGAQRATAAAAYLAANADFDELVMTPMRDGVRLASTIIFPKGKPRQNLPVVLLRNPYYTGGMIQSFGVYTESLIRNGYAVMFQNVRGRYFSEGTYTFLVGSGADGYDTVDWIIKQPWSNGKVGLLGCSSSAEEQHKLQGLQHPAVAAGVPMGSGAGIGRVGPYNEMGNFYRGGVIQGLWFPWYYSAGYINKPQFAKDLPRETMLRIARFWNIQPNMMPPSGIDSLIWTLPINQVMERMKAMPSDIDDWVNREPNDPRWKAVDFGGEGDKFGAPMLMINSWYDVSIGPNVALWEYEMKNAATAAAREQSMMVIAPTPHCAQGSFESAETIVGERNLGDARFDYIGLIQKFFDKHLKGVANGVEREPKVRAFMMGSGQWKNYDSWPPAGARDVTWWLDSDGGANSSLGNGRLVSAQPKKALSDVFLYDPLRPVPSLGGSICCFSAAQKGGSFDQSTIERRNDVLVYSSAPLEAPVEIAGSVKVTLYLSSDARDTDLTVKLLDVDAEGRAYNLDESIQRVRWRDGWEKPVFMEAGKVYKVEVGPLVTSASFARGHRIRVEVSSSNFPRFERNLNTGGPNAAESRVVVARNAIHHGPAYPSSVTLPVLR